MCSYLCLCTLNLGRSTGSSCSSWEMNISTASRRKSCGSVRTREPIPKPRYPKPKTRPPRPEARSQVFEAIFSEAAAEMASKESGDSDYT